MNDYKILWSWIFFFWGGGGEVVSLYINAFNFFTKIGAGLQVVGAIINFVSYVLVGIPAAYVLGVNPLQWSNESLVLCSFLLPQFPYFCIELIISFIYRAPGDLAWNDYQRSLCWSILDSRFGESRLDWAERA